MQSKKKKKIEIEISCMDGKKSCEIQGTTYGL